MNIAFCCDKAALPGLHVSLFTLLKADRSNCSSFKIFILYEGFSEADKRGLMDTAGLVGKAKINFKEFSTGRLRHLKSFHGNYMTYARLFLSEQLPEVQRVLYLDSDLYLTCSVAPLASLQLGQDFLGAVTSGTIAWSLESSFFRELGLSATDPYFNAGVLLVDLERWRSERLDDQVTKFLERFGERCQAADQTVLNALFSRRHRSIDRKYNLPLYPHEHVSKAKVPEAICHFVGAPKPWDFGGRWLHGSGRLFYGTLKETAFYQSGGRVPVSVGRTVRLGRSYLQLIRKRKT